LGFVRSRWLWLHSDLGRRWDPRRIHRRRNRCSHPGRRRRHRRRFRRSRHKR
ncbi:hypothetical protein NDU88_004364, partial [Pleurodeles waltl]